MAGDVLKGHYSMNLSLFGLIASVWLVVGVFVTAKIYAGYNYKRQFMSELGARNAPTQKLSPLINNIPLSILFSLFGIGLINTAGLSIVGYCVVIHGLGTLIAGVFPMDHDPYTTTPSAACKIHFLAGLVMFVSLFTASAITIFVDELGVIFRLFSAVITIFTVYFVVRLSGEYAQKGNVGLYQRLGYGVQLFWLSCLSIWLFTGF